MDTRNIEILAKNKSGYYLASKCITPSYDGIQYYDYYLVYLSWPYGKEGLEKLTLKELHEIENTETILNLPLKNYFPFQRGIYFKDFDDIISIQEICNIVFKEMKLDIKDFIVPFGGIGDDHYALLKNLVNADNKTLFDYYKIVYNHFKTYLKNKTNTKRGKDDKNKTSLKNKTNTKGGKDDKNKARFSKNKIRAGR
jgi:hypothetical protein